MEHAGYVVAGLALGVFICFLHAKFTAPKSSGTGGSGGSGGSKGTVHHK